MAAVSSLGRTFALMAFLVLGASFVLQLLDSLSTPFIKSLSFLSFDIQQSQQHGDVGIWGYCVKNSVTPQQCHQGGLADYGALDSFFASGAQQANANYASSFSSGLGKALVLQPIATGLTGLAAVMALLAMCMDATLWLLITFLAAAATIATMVVELLFFIHARNNVNALFSQLFSNGSYNVKLGNAMWVEVGALAAVLGGALLALSAFILNITKDEKVSSHEPLPVYRRPEPAAVPAEESYAAPANYTAPAVDTFAAGRGYDSAQPYETGAVAPALRPTPLYNARDAGSRPGEPLRPIERGHSRRHSRRHSHRPSGEHRRSRSHRHSRSLGKEHEPETSHALASRHSNEYNYDFDAFPARRFSYDYGNTTSGQSHMRHRSTGSNYRPLSRSASRMSRLYPNDSGEVLYDTAIRRTPMDGARPRDSRFIMY